MLLGYYGSVLWLARRVRKRAPDGGIWYYRAFAIERSMVGLMVASVFADRLYGEAPYWIGGLAVALHRLQSHKLRQESEATHEAPKPSAVPAEPTLGDYVRSRWPTAGTAG